MSNPTYLDLDAVDAEVDVTINFKGVKHKLVPITVEAFIANMKAVQKLGVSADTEAETNMLLEMLMHAFPTMTMADLRSMSLSQMAELMNFAKKYNGQEKTEQAMEAEAAANPPTPAS